MLTNSTVKKNSIFHESSSKTTPKVSVIMPVMNTPKTVLKRSLQSILTQSFKSFELIIVDDCSQYMSLLQTYKNFHKNISIVRMESSCHLPSICMNQGLKHAKGTYIYYHTPDTFVPKFHLEKLYNALEDGPYTLSYTQDFISFTSKEQLSNFPNIRIMHHKELLPICGHYNPHILLKNYSCHDLWSKLSQVSEPTSPRHDEKSPETLLHALNLCPPLVKKYIDFYAHTCFNHKNLPDFLIDDLAPVKHLYNCSELMSIQNDYILPHQLKIPHYYVNAMPKQAICSNFRVAMIYESLPSSPYRIDFYQLLKRLGMTVELIKANSLSLEDILAYDILCLYNTSTGATTHYLTNFKTQHKPIFYVMDRPVFDELNDRSDINQLNYQIHHAHTVFTYDELLTKKCRHHNPHTRTLFYTTETVPYRNPLDLRLSPMRIAVFLLAPPDDAFLQGMQKFASKYKKHLLIDFYGDFSANMVHFKCQCNFYAYTDQNHMDTLLQEKKYHLSINYIPEALPGSGKDTLLGLYFNQSALGTEIFFSKTPYNTFLPRGGYTEINEKAKEWYHTLKDCMEHLEASQFTTLDHQIAFLKDYHNPSIVIPTFGEGLLHSLLAAHMKNGTIGFYFNGSHISDEAIQLMDYAHILLEAGYEVLLCFEGSECQPLLQERAQHYHLPLCKEEDFYYREDWLNENNLRILHVLEEDYYYEDVCHLMRIPYIPWHSQLPIVIHDQYYSYYHRNYHTRNLKPDTIRLLIHGPIERESGILKVIPAIEHLRKSYINLQLNIVTCNDYISSYEETCIAYIKKHNLEGIVQIHHTTTPESFYNEYTHYYISCDPNRKADSSLMKSMASGIPILCASDFGLLVDGESCKIFSQETTEEISRALLQIIEENTEDQLYKLRMAHTISKLLNKPQGAKTSILEFYHSVLQEEKSE